MNKNILWKLHSWTGLYFGIIIAFLSITGAAALFRAEVDEWLNPKLYQVEAQSSKVRLTQTVEKIIATHPDKYLFEVEFTAHDKGTWNVRLFPEQQNKTFPVIWEVFVNPYNGEILGERNYYQTFSYYLRNIHVRFYEGINGRQIVGLAGIALLISTLTGLFIYGRFMKRMLFATIRYKNIRIQQADYHKLIGILALFFNLVIALTGTWLGLQTYLMDWFSITQPNKYVRMEKPISKDEDKTLAFNWDTAYHVARHQFPSLIPISMRPSTNGEATVGLFGDVPGQIYERNSNKIVLDKRNYEVLHHYNINEQKVGAKIYYIQEALHFGDFGGLVLKFFYCLLGITSGFLSLSGFIIYVERTQRKEIKANVYHLRRKLVLWSGGILAFCFIIAILSTWLSIGIPTIIVSTLFYLLLLFFVVRAIILIIKRKFFRKNEPAIIP